MSKDFPTPVKEMASFLSFFAASRMYAPIDKLSRPFSIEDVINTINDVLRQISVIFENPDGEETIEGRRARYIIDERSGLRRKIYIPRIPSEETVKNFIQLCSEDLNYARITAALALAHAPKRVRELEKEEVGEEA